MRWKYRANQAVSKLKETADVKTKIERNSIKHQTGAASISMAKIFINFD
jgi:hypothetical protein